MVDAQGGVTKWTQRVDIHGGCIRWKQRVDALGGHIHSHTRWKHKIATQLDQPWKGTNMIFLTMSQTECYIHQIYSFIQIDIFYVAQNGKNTLKWFFKNDSLEKNIKRSSVHVLYGDDGAWASRHWSSQHCMEHGRFTNLQTGIVMEGLIYANYVDRKLTRTLEMAGIRWTSGSRPTWKIHKISFF